MNLPNLRLTTLGINAVLDVVYSGETLTFTGIKIGDTRTSREFEDMTDLVHTVMEVGITSCTVGSGFATLEFSFNNADIDESFYLREMGIFARIGEGSPFLYAYTNAGDDASYVKKYGEDDNIIMHFFETVAIGSAEHVTAIINGAIGYVTDEEFEEHLTDYNNPHRVTKEQVGLGNVPNRAPSDMEVTFDEASTLTNLTSGTTLAQLMGLLSRAVRNLLSHLTDNSNPHSTTYSQIGAAAAIHAHNASAITSGSLPVSRGGTGCTSLADLKNTVNREISYVSDMIRKTGWSNKQYDMGYAGYHIDVALSNSATSSQFEAFANAGIVGSPDSNIIKAYGTVPTVDIPVIVKKIEIV